MGSLKHRVNFSFLILEKLFFHCFSVVLLSNCHCPIFLKLCLFFFFNLEMAQLGNYDSGTAETPETDESVSVSIFVDEI